MLHTVVIDNIFGISQLLMEQVYRPDLKRYRSLYIYRGMSNADFQIISSLRRICKYKAPTLEPVILSNFTKYAALEDPSIETSIWRQMILGQHHGLQKQHQQSQQPVEGPSQNPLPLQLRQVKVFEQRGPSFQNANCRMQDA